ncbi:MAG: glycosyltransferase family 2 protein [Rhodospirillales bacterium]|nr:MAG: glycosyltransferase family 2 protein [Rhodospirillales bacterium]
MVEISVVIPCFNGGAELPRALASLEKQTFRDFEIIVVDDGSTDAPTIAFLDKLPSSIRILHQENRGLPAARNAGMRAATGRFLLPLDCDDQLEPEFLSECLTALTAHPEAAFAFAQMRLEGELTGVTRKSYNPFAQLFLNQLPYCLMLRRQAWEEAGGYDETMRGGYEDWEFNIRLSSLGLHGILVDRPLFVYRTSQQGMLNSLSRRAHAALWLGIQRKHSKLFSLAGLWKARRQWRHLALPYPLPLLLGLLAAHRLLPQSWFNALYARLLSFSAARRTRGEN